MSNDIVDPQTIKNTEEPEPTEDQKRAKFFVGDLMDKIDDEGVNVAFTIIMDPKCEQPIIYTKGSTYQLTRLLVDMSRYFKARLDQELKV